MVVLRKAKFIRKSYWPNLTKPLQPFSQALVTSLTKLITKFQLTNYPYLTQMFLLQMKRIHSE